MQVTVQPNETLFETGDESSSGIFIVLEGAVGVYMHDGDKLMHTNTLRPGESVGDVDVLDGERHHHSQQLLVIGQLVVLAGPHGVSSAKSNGLDHSSVFTSNEWDVQTI